MSAAPRPAYRPALTRRRRRLYLLLAAMAVLGVATALMLNAFRDSLVFFYSPTELATKPDVPRGRMIRIGGLVQQGSVVRNGADVRFAVTDLKRTVTVTYHGILPDLFREGQGVVVQGKLDPGGTFVADQVLAKHDERYMPPEVAEALKKSGRWKEGQLPGPHPGTTAPQATEGTEK